MTQTKLPPANPARFKLAAAYGCHTARPNRFAEPETATTAAFAPDGPTLIELRENAEFLG
ncbi:hypothetical protein GCM10007874_11080 [Labrys miyagiensis]|uniref:Uncharacterized protein n=1 Tax=Labrys miyagiensis TaxID=346912 RepID=A0ABQ6CCK7_9HYPH|nr:hypothetical protein GCM10007874_11080 [Labrys miyagiensis]